MAAEPFSVGIVVERLELSNPWQDCQWRTLAVLAEPPPVAGEAWILLRSEGPRRHYLAGVLPLAFWPDDVASYRFNLESTAPSLYVVLRAQEDMPEAPYRLIMVSAAPDEVQPLMESGGDLIDAVPMPPAIQARLAAFVAAHPETQPFVKRQRKAWAPERPGAESRHQHPSAPPHPPTNPNVNKGTDTGRRNTR